MTTRTFADVLRIETATLQAAYPDRANEVSRAHALIRNGQVVPMDQHTARVLSSTDATVWYDVNGTCSCPDAHYRKAHCKHLSAWKLYQHVQKQLDAQSTPVEPVPALAHDASADAAALPEARCSMNVHLTIGGRDVQVTLRGHDEIEVLARLETVLQRYPLPAQAPEPTHTSTEGWCPVHSVQMRLNPGKDGKPGWWSHKVDGQWCKGRKGGAR